MPTLEELRRWARGEAVEGMQPIEKGSDKPLPPVITGARETKQFKLNADGTDALLLFGTMFRGKKLTELVATPRGRKYMLWMLGREFDESLKAVIRYQMELHKRAK